MLRTATCSAPLPPLSLALAAALVALVALPARAGDLPPVTPPATPSPETPTGAPAAARKASVSGRVVDDTGKPFAGAKVSACGAQVPALSTTTDAEGRFRIDGIDPDAATIQMTADGPPGVYGSQPPCTTWPGMTDVEVVLERAAILTGAVRRRGDGAPVAGAFVWRADSYSAWVDVHYGRAGLSDDGFETPLARTDAEGRYALAGFPPGEGRVLVAASPDLAIDAVRLDVAPGVTRTADFALGAGAALSGRVLDADGAPVAGAVVVGDWPRDDSNGYTDDLDALRQDAKRALEYKTDIAGPQLTRSGLPTFLLRRASRTDEQGRFAFPRLPAGRRTLAIAAPGLLPTTISAELADGGPAQTVEARLARSATLAGRAAFADGKAATGGFIHCTRLVPGAPPDNVPEYTWISVERDGTLRVESVEPGAYVLSGSLQLADPKADPNDVEAPPLRDERLPPVVVRLEGGKTVEVVLGGAPRGRRVVVRVKRRGAPAANVPVSLRLDGLPHDDFWSGDTDAEGSVRLPGAPPGAYTLLVGAFVTREVVVAAGEAEPPVHVELPGGVVRGRVVDASGAAVVSATAVASLTPPGKEWYLGRTVPFGRTDAEGRFAVEGLPAGRFEVTISGHGHAPHATMTAVAAGGEAVVDATLAPGARIHVRLEGFTVKGSSFMSSPPTAIAVGGPGAKMYWSNQDASGSPTPSLEAPEVRELAELPPGTYTLLAIGMGDRVARLDGVTASAGTAVEVTLAGVAPGSIDAHIRDAGGKPVPAALVSTRLPVGHEVPADALFTLPPPSPVDADGRMLRSGLAPGAYVVRARRVEGEGAWASATVEVNSGRVTRVELTLP